MHLKAALLSTVVGVMSAGMAPAQSWDADWNVLLPQDSVAELPDAAMAPYQEALVLTDVVAYDLAILKLAEAAEKAPLHEDLQFLVASRAQERAENYFSATVYSEVPASMDYSSPPWRTSEAFLEVAENALQRLQENSRLTTSERLRLERINEEVRAMREQKGERDSARLETGFSLVKKIAERRRLDFEERFGTGEEEDLEVFAFLKQPLPGEDVAALPGEEEDAEAEYDIDPFALLPGERIKNFLPTPIPQQYQGGQGYPPGYDPYGLGGPAGMGMGGGYMGEGTPPAEYQGFTGDEGRF